MNQSFKHNQTIQNGVSLNLQQFQTSPTAANASKVETSAGNGITYMQVRRSREARAVMSRERHISKLVTIYVVDKLNFNLQKQQRARDILTNQSFSNDNQSLECQALESQLRPKIHNLRSSSAPTKGQHPCHFKHGLRTQKHCIVCEGVLKTPNQQEKEKEKEKEKQDSKLPEEIMNSEKKFPLQDNRQTTTYSIDGGNFSERGYNPKNQAYQLQEIIPPAKSLQLAHEDSISTVAKKELQTQSQEQYPKLTHTQSILQSKHFSGEPTKRDGDIEEYQRRRITLNDFLHGQPSMKLMFTKHVRKFNRELLKATCLVIGCKRMYAHKIADKVFDEFDQIINSLSENLGFQDHFQISMNFEGGEQKLYSESQQKMDVQNAQPLKKIKIRDRLSETDMKKNITTITISAQLFKYILKRYLVEKYRYSRPEYLQDFYVASDLVQSKRNILVLLAGTSGTGKSTLSSLLGSRLGISTVISTDTIRHVMRNFISKEDDPIIFASTYETASFVSDDIQSKKKRTLIGYKDQCQKVQTELEKVIDDYQRRNESLVVEGVHLTIRFMKQMMKKYPSCIPFVICITNEDKHKERFAVRTKHMTIDPKFNKYIKNVQSIRTIQKYLIKKAEESLIPRIDNSNIDKSIGLIHATIVRCLRKISEGAQIFDEKRKQAIIMHQEFANISKNKLSSKDAQKFFIHQKVNKNEILAEYMKQQANPELQEKLKRYKKSYSMGDLWQGKKNMKKQKQNKEETKEEANLLLNQIKPIFILPDSQIVQNSSAFYSEHEELSPRAKSIHVIMRPEVEPVKLTEVEKKAIKRQILNVFEDFPEDEESYFGDSKAAQMVAASSIFSDKKAEKYSKDKKSKIFNLEEQKLRDQKKRQSDQQKQNEEEKIKLAILEAQQKEKDELEAAAIIEENRNLSEKEEKQKRIQQMLLILPKSQSLVLPGQENDGNSKINDNDQNSFRAINKSFEFIGDGEDINFPQPYGENINNSSPTLNITNVKNTLKRDISIKQNNFISNKFGQFDINEEICEIPKILGGDDTNIIKKDENFVFSCPDSQQLSNQEHQKQVERFDRKSKHELKSNNVEFGAKYDSKVTDLQEIQQENYVNLGEMKLQNSSLKEPSNIHSINIEIKTSQSLNEQQKHLIHDTIAAKYYDSVQNNGIANINNASTHYNLEDMTQTKTNMPIKIDQEDIIQVKLPTFFEKKNNVDSVLGRLGLNIAEKEEGGSSEGSNSNNEDGLSFRNQLVQRQGSTDKKPLDRRTQQYLGYQKVLRDKSGTKQYKATKHFGKLPSFNLHKMKEVKITKGRGQILGASQANLLSIQQPLNEQKHAILKSQNLQNYNHHHLNKSQENSGSGVFSNVHHMHQQDDNYSIYSGSGLAPSLISQSINFFPQGGPQTDNHSVAHGLEKLNESGQSSDETNSQDAEASDNDTINEEDVSYSHSSESDNDEEQEDAIAKKQTSFNKKSSLNNSLQNQQQQQMQSLNKAKSQEGAHDTSNNGVQENSPPKENEIMKSASVGSQKGILQTMTQSKSQPNDNQIMMQGVNFNALNASTGEEESGGGGDAYDKIKPLSKKSFDEDKNMISAVGLGGFGGNFNLETNNSNITCKTSSNALPVSDS